MTEAARIEAISAAIRRYLQLRPQAADTLEGIHRWWVDWGECEEGPELTELALQALQEQALVEVTEIAGRRIWRGKGVE